MWKPSSADQLIQAINANTLPHESAAFEVKEKLPGRQANSDVAIDVAAMATDGGVIIYGVRENKQTVTFTSKPIELAGVKDRISDIVTSSVSERVEFEILQLPLDGDQSRGFVVVDVPASPRAPHMVEVKGEYCYYGRVPGGNVQLTEAQVARLYERREESERNALRSLNDAILAAPIPPAAPGFRGDLHIVVHPLVSNNDVRGRAWPGEDPGVISSAITTVMNELRFTPPLYPDFGDLRNGGRQEPTLDGIALTNHPIVHGDSEPNERWVARLEVLDDGTCRYFHAAVAQRESASSTTYVIMSSGIAQTTARFVALAGHVLDNGGYHGIVDVSLSITGAAGAVSAEWFDPSVFSVGANPMPRDDYLHRERLLVNRLVDDPCEVADQMLARLFRIIRSPNFPDPLRR